jgi:phosphorylcholine metabolism protein LicD
MNKESALENLKILDNIFRNMNKEYWVSCGTLLGFYREGDFIAHDTDTDLCVDIKNLDKKLLDEIKKQGFKIKTVFGRYEDGFEIALVRGGVKTDLFFFYKNESKWYYSVYHNGQKFDFVYEPFGLKETVFKGYSFMTPDDIEHYLRQKYGDDWRVPRTKWNYWSSPKNSRPAGKAPSAAESKSDLTHILNSF